ncbi:MAG: adenylate/guanylate cyclase domain-containing protein [Actinomycetaceae bacterium]|nr:adenylate/guanylate cyclase domain-containing protein [Actinomycetaceae bacterium]
MNENAHRDDSIKSSEDTAHDFSSVHVTPVSEPAPSSPQQGTQIPTHTPMQNSAQSLEETTEQTSAQIVENYVEQLLGGEGSYTVPEAAQMCGVTIEEVLRFWRALGFPRIDDINNERLFTPSDVEAMREHAEMLKRPDQNTALSRETIQMLIRAQAQSMDRLVFWQQEALVEYAERVLGLDANAARAWLLEHMDDYEEFLSSQMNYAWRRYMSAMLRRTELESNTLSPDMTSNYVSWRALGFIDLVSFTRHTGELGDMELLAFIDAFDRACRDVITSKGGRVVKNIGDAFLYTAHSIEIALDITTSIVDKLRKIEGMLPVHASVVWGEVITRFGDVFGTTVNRASRLAAAAMPNTVLTDEKTASIIHKLGLKYVTVDLWLRDLHGLGSTRLMEVRRIMGA